MDCYLRHYGLEITLYYFEILKELAYQYFDNHRVMGLYNVVCRGNKIHTTIIDPL